MRIYLSAPIQSDPNHRSVFEHLTLRVLETGHHPVNPLTVEPECNGCPHPLPGKAHSWECYLRWDLVAMLQCEAVYFSQNWQQSPGCRLEHYVASNSGLTLIHYHAIDLYATRKPNGSL